MLQSRIVKVSFNLFHYLLFLPHFFTGVPSRMISEARTENRCVRRHAGARQLSKQCAMTPPGLLPLFALISLTSRERRERMLAGRPHKKTRQSPGANERHDEL